MCLWIELVQWWWWWCSRVRSERVSVRNWGVRSRIKHNGNNKRMTSREDFFFILKISIFIKKLLLLFFFYILEFFVVVYWVPPTTFFLFLWLNNWLDNYRISSDYSTHGFIQKSLSKIKFKSIYFMPLFDMLPSFTELINHKFELFMNIFNWV